jgi:hypothetical protein
LGELPDDLRSTGPWSAERDSGGAFLFEGDAFSSYGGAFRTGLEPLPSFTSTTAGDIVKGLPRQNYESFRSQQFFGRGALILAPSSGTTFTALFSLTVPQGFAAVITLMGQCVLDASAYNKADGTLDDVIWRVTVAGSPIFSYGNFPFVISSGANQSKMFAVIQENTTIELQASNSLVVGSFGARNIPVSGFLLGHQFPVDEVDDMFRNR